MAGIYIHIPFCKKLCNYCDFHKSLSPEDKSLMINALVKEMKMQNEFLGTERVDTIYFGGGTPSVLSYDETEILFEGLYRNFKISKNAEITIEANPDDLTIKHLAKLRKTKVNRLSIGVQSFSDRDLKLMNRRHQSNTGLKAVYNSQNTGFGNISIDLIYGIPGMSLETWENNLDIAFQMGIQHISAYHLTIEADTVFSRRIKEGNMKMPDEEISIEQFRILIKKAGENKFLHYEISNFCLDEFFSKHNTNYWKQVKYLGLGPSAHSYNGNIRQWNVSDNKIYIDTISKNKIPFEKEYLDNRKKYNEYILTSLRTMWGIDLKFLEENYSKEAMDYCLGLSKRFFDYGMIEKKGDNLVLTNQGKLIADNIISELMMSENRQKLAT